MATGRLGALDTAATTNEIVYTCPADTIATVTVNICRRAGGETVRIAHMDSDDVADIANEDYLHYDDATVEQTSGIVMAAGQSIVIYASAATVSVVVWGFEESTT